jgi:hypothetical protein
MNFISLLFLFSGLPLFCGDQKQLCSRGDTVYGVDPKYLRTVSCEPSIYIADPRTLVDQLRVSPLLVLKEIEKQHDIVKRQAENCLLKRGENVFSLFEAEQYGHPLFLLGECNAGSCPLNRYTNENDRTVGAKKIAAAYINEIGENNNAISYTSFGSGDLYQDLLILTEVLTAKPNATICINFIDRAYRTFKDMKESKDILSRVANAIKYKKTREQGKQFVSFIITCFPFAQFIVRQFTSNDAFLDHYKHYKEPIPRVVHAVDIAEGNGVYYFKDLLSRIIGDNNTLASGILLAGEWHKKEISIFTKDRQKSKEKTIIISYPGAPIRWVEPAVIVLHEEVEPIVEPMEKENPKQLLEYGLKVVPQQ